MSECKCEHASVSACLSVCEVTVSGCGGLASDALTVSYPECSNYRSIVEPKGEPRDDVSG